MSNPKIKRAQSGAVEQPPESLFWTPQEIGATWAEYAAQSKTEAESGEGITWGVQSLDRNILPLRRGKILAILARPGHGKSTCAVYLAKRAAKQIVSRGDMESIIIYITVDQSVEAVNSIIQSESGYNVSDIAWGRVDVEKIRTLGMQRAALPIWMMGKSVVERRHQRRMTYDNVYAEIEEISKRYGKKIALIVIDYVQNFPIDGKRTRGDEVTEAIKRARELCLTVAAPMVLCVQASREVDNRDNKIPQMGDCQHASAIEQEVDAIASVWRPCLTEGDDLHIDAFVGGVRTKIPITPNLFVVGVPKQRDEQAGKIFYLHFDPALVRLSDLELK